MEQDHLKNQIKEVKNKKNLDLDTDYSGLRLALSGLPVDLFIRFAVVGLSGVAVDLGVFALLQNSLSLPLTPSAMLSTEVAIINNFLWNDVWTFSDVSQEQQAISQQLQRFFKFNLICCLGLILNGLIVNWLFYKFGVNEYIAKLGGNRMCYPLEFLAKSKAKLASEVGQYKANFKVVFRDDSHHSRLQDSSTR